MVNPRPFQGNEARRALHAVVQDLGDDVTIVSIEELIARGADRLSKMEAAELTAIERDYDDPDGFFTTDRMLEGRRLAKELLAHYADQRSILREQASGVITTAFGYATELMLAPMHKAAYEATAPLRLDQATMHADIAEQKARAVSARLQAEDAEWQRQQQQQAHERELERIKNAGRREEVILKGLENAQEHLRRVEMAELEGGQKLQAQRERLAASMVELTLKIEQDYHEFSSEDALDKTLRAMQRLSTIWDQAKQAEAGGDADLAEKLRKMHTEMSKNVTGSFNTILTRSHKPRS